MQLRSVFAVALLLSASLAARADATYFMTSNDYSTATPPFSPSQNVTGSFTVASALGDNFSGTVSPLSFSFNDGLNVFASPSEIVSFSIDTNAVGAISGYNINLNDTIDPFNMDTLQIGAGTLSSTYLTQLPNPFPNQPPFTELGAATANGVVWTASLPPAVTPEPSSAVLFGSGVLLLAGLMRRRFS